MWTVLEFISDLGENECLRAAAVQTEHETDGLEKLLDASPKLVLLHPTGGTGVEDPWLDDELKQVL